MSRPSTQMDSVKAAKVEREQSDQLPPQFMKKKAKGKAAGKKKPPPAFLAGKK
jgi:hypothetical protein